MEQVRVIEVEVLLLRPRKRHCARDIVDQDVGAEQLLHDLEEQWVPVNALIHERAFQLRGKHRPTVTDLKIVAACPSTHQ
jgi:hypothetical protein